MAAEPRVYRWDDDSAPVPTDKQNALYEILKPVLVDGYGSQPAAGWSVVYDAWSSDGVCTLTNAAESGVLGMVRNATTSYGATLFIADAMIDATHAVTARSGWSERTDISALSNRSGNSCFSGYSNRYKHWIVIANENFLVAFFASSSSYLFGSYTSLSWYYLEGFAAGAFRSLRGGGGISTANPGNFCLIGAPIGSDSQVAWHSASAMCLTDESGSVVAGTRYGELWPWGTGGSDSLGLSEANSFVQLPLRPMELWTHTTSSTVYMHQIGLFPMMLCSQSFRGNNTNLIADQLGPDRLATPVIIANKPAYTVNMPYGGHMILSMALEDWV